MQGTATTCTTTAVSCSEMMMNEKLMRLLTFEQYIPVMNEAEQAALLSGVPFHKESILKWKAGLEKRNETLEGIFRRAYEKQKGNKKGQIR